jgi:hypothetical protein
MDELIWGGLGNLRFLQVNPLEGTSLNPFRRGSQGCGTFVHQNHAAGGETVHHGGDVCELCVLLAKSLPIGSLLFLPELT